jgi:CheY-like chemotaxis protein
MTGTQSKFSCLLVDDDPNIISLLESLFRDTSYQIYTAMDGKSALSLMDKVRIDATLIDLVMLSGNHGDHTFRLRQRRIRGRGG